MFFFALERLWHHRFLALFLAAGMVAAVALTVAVPLYADGVNRRLLDAALATTAAKERTPPFDFIFHYIGSWYEPVDPAHYVPVDAYMRNQFANTLGLPQERLTRYVSSGNLQLYPGGESIQRSQRLDLVKLAFVSGLFEHVRLVEGRLPQPVTGSQTPIEGLASLDLANQLGLRTGQTYLLYYPGSPPAQIPVRITGFWLPQDPAGTFWFYPPEALEKRLLLPEETFFGPVAQTLPLPIDEAVWRISLDGGAVNGDAVPGLLARIDRAQIQINTLLPHTDLETSPVPALRQYRRQSLALTGLLFLFSAPILGLTFYFLGLVADLFVRRQRDEIAILRGRGASRRWILGLYGLEWTLVGGIALGSGLGLGVGTARLIGNATSFLQFSGTRTLPTQLSWSAVGFGLASVGLALGFSLLPAWQAGRDTIVSHKREQARRRRKPLWRRFYLDVFLLLSVLYNLYVLRQPEDIPLLNRPLASGNPFENPFLFLLPTLFILALTLLLLRLLPKGLAALEKLLCLLPGVVPVLVFRQLARKSHLGPLALLVITLALAGFVASMAQTLDRSLADSLYYRIGADLNLVEGGEYTGETPAIPGAGGLPGGAASATLAQENALPEDPALWNFLPVSEHLRLPGVLAATRVGRYQASLEAGGQSANGQLIGVDRAAFPEVAFFRDDFASEPLVGLMNRLASTPDALLVDQATWRNLNLNTGDSLTMQVTFGETKQISFKVVGVLNRFPTTDPETTSFFVANLEYIFESFGGYLPYEVWLRTSPGANREQILRGVNEMGVNVIRIQDARSALAEIMAAPSRQGTLGLLSTGFLAAALLSAVGFLLHTLFSLRQRFVQFGVLRALGLSIRQMGLFLALEHIFLILIVLLAGTAMAVLSAYLFIPQIPTGFDDRLQALPHLVTIAWKDILWIQIALGVVLFVGSSLTLRASLRGRVSQAIKLGENL